MQLLRNLRHRVPDTRPARGILDTSVVIDLDALDPTNLPLASAVSALTMAELAAGPHSALDAAERAKRQERLQRATQSLDALAFDDECARAYGRIFAAVAASGRKARGARAVGLLIAATALAHGLPLYTRNGADFMDLDQLLTIVVV